MKAFVYRFPASDPAGCVVLPARSDIMDRYVKLRREVGGRCDPVEIAAADWRYIRAFHRRFDWRYGSDGYYVWNDIRHLFG